MRRVNVIYLVREGQDPRWLHRLLDVFGDKHDLSIHDRSRPIEPQFADVEVVLDHGGSSMTPELVAASKKCKLWHILTVGYDLFDMDTMRKAGIPVANVLGVPAATLLGQQLGWRAAFLGLSNVRQVNLARFLQVDATTLSALQVFSTEDHPSMVRGKGRAKEGFSLLSLLGRLAGRARASRVSSIAPLIALRLRVSEARSAAMSRRSSLCFTSHSAWISKKM